MQSPSTLLKELSEKLFHTVTRQHYPFFILTQASKVSSAFNTHLHFHFCQLPARQYFPFTFPIPHTQYRQTATQTKWCRNLPSENNSNPTSHNNHPPMPKCMLGCICGSTTLPLLTITPAVEETLSCAYIAMPSAKKPNPISIETQTYTRNCQACTLVGGITDNPNAPPSNGVAQLQH